jgi:hypothetical protein
MCTGLLLLLLLLLLPPPPPLLLLVLLVCTANCSSSPLCTSSLRNSLICVNFAWWTVSRDSQRTARGTTVRAGQTTGAVYTVSSGDHHNINAAINSICA